MSAAEKELYERLASEVAVDTDDDRAGTPIRGVAIGAGDVSKGQSGTRTRWPADVLEAAAETLAGEEVPVIEGPGGPSGHYELSEQVPPEDLVGAVEFNFTEGVGLTYTGEVVDESLARKIDAGVLEVSPDMLRRLDDDGAGAAEATEILDIPRLTLVERAAGPSASVEVAGGEEALAEYLSGPDPEVEQMAEGALLAEDLYDRRPGESAVELLARRDGLDATEYDSEQELRDDRRAKRRADEPDTYANPGTTAYKFRKRQQQGEIDDREERLGAQGSTGSMSTESHSAPSPGPSSRGEEDGELEEFIAGAMTARGIKTCTAEGLTRVEYAEQLGVDPAEYDDQRALSRAMRESEKNRGR